MVSAKLAELATNRLVLLGSKTGGQVAFDVRSLQEFMAAARLMSSPEGRIEERLREISAKSHWRHVMRICCSKVFAQSELRRLRPMIISICSALDEGDWSPPDRVVRAGARLAMDLLSDGIAVRVPGDRRALVSRAMRLLDLRASDAVGLSSFLDEQTQEIFEEELRRRLSPHSGLQSVPAWALILTIIRQHSSADWALKLVRESWPASAQQALEIVENVDNIFLADPISDLLKKCQITAGFWRTYEALRSVVYREDDAFDKLSVIPRDALILPRESDSRDRAILRFGNRVAAITYQSIRRPCLDASLTCLGDSSEFLAVWVRSMFIQNPSNATLAQALKQIASAKCLEAARSLINPWPLEAALLTAGNENDLVVLADIVIHGGFGDVDDWMAAEDCWTRQGTTWDDFMALRGGTFIRPDIGAVGIPAFYTVSIEGRPGQQSMPPEIIRGSQELVESLNGVPPGLRRFEIIKLLSPFIGRWSRAARWCMHRQLIGDWAVDAERIGALRMYALLQRAREEWEDEGFVMFANDVGLRLTRLQPYISMPMIIARTYNAAPDSRGLLPFLAGAALVRRPDNARVWTILSDVAFEIRSSDTNVVKGSVALLRLLSDRWDAPDADLAITALVEITTPLGPAPLFRQRIARAAEDGERVKLLRILANASRGRSMSLYGAALSELKATLERRRSTLAEVSTLERLELPLMDERLNPGRR